MAFVFLERRFLISGIVKTRAANKNNIIKNAPHTLCQLTIEEWDKPYSRAKAAFPQPCSKADKYWRPVTKIDDAYGDRNLMCTCHSFSQTEE